MEAALIAIVASAVGGAAGAWWSGRLRLRAEREDQIRQRMLLAADEFSTGFLQAQLGLQRFQQSTGDESVAKDDLLTESARLVEEAHALLARVTLLFGEETDAGQAATGCIGLIRRTLRKAKQEDSAGFERELNRSYALASVFTREALRLIREPNRVELRAEEEYSLDELLARHGIA